jgi:hypothetical protein
MRAHPMFPIQYGMVSESLPGRTEVDIGEIVGHYLAWVAFAVFRCLNLFFWTRPKETLVCLGAPPIPDGQRFGLPSAPTPPGE